ncbi:MAG: hypothetical protein CVV64_08985 [Candidatus Wallbacteria bacterium HGW-Wallbacteria-1]|jgi:oxygen-independent coproporphyrinogen-3 oxidase|uniref:Heme chaperone HemW n=1 Tax=Candidatus Wallbacteria bacterium HGW-Wallbacteria-1 TaxID=2013854 RepID=A0A2N1PQ75_9BACT|nr:MAG: hypothetical protein CVV64_08985 [Candidatus Wallbacteria bacterium HGW-Wallbacteria-1]
MAAEFSNLPAELLRIYSTFQNVSGWTGKWSSPYPPHLWNRWNPFTSKRALSIYIHIPFCLRKCEYCSFYSEPFSQQRADHFITTLFRELEWWRNTAPAAKVATLYIGGGTPSLLGSSRLNSIIDRVFSLFEFQVDSQRTSNSPDSEIGSEIRSEPEITIEVNPETVNCHTFFSETRANRFSIGVQSFDPANLRILGRGHSSSEAMESLVAAMESGARVSGDLMFSLPDQTLLDWMDDLELMVSAGVGHISIYDLHPGEGTPLEKGWKSDPDREHAMYWWARRRLENRGFQSYEISNFALPGHESLHNLRIWRGEDFIGLGPGAHSRVAGLRWQVPSNLSDYLCDHSLNGSSSDQYSPVMNVFEENEREILSSMAIMALRCSHGISDSFLRDRIGAGCIELFPDALNELAGEGLIVSDFQGMRLTLKGVMFGNRVFSAFL